MNTITPKKWLTIEEIISMFQNLKIMHIPEGKKTGSG